jgi:hypothetical protein
MKTGLIFYLAIFSVYTGFSQINRGIIETNNVNTESKSLLPSTFHAIIIAESNYSDPSFLDLDSDPIKDANNLSKILIQKYSFNRNNVDLLIDASRNEIIDN